MNSRVDSVIRIKGANFALHRAGAGEPVLYLHGIDGAPPALALMEMLAQQHDVLLPEHPGFGASDMPQWFENIHDLAYYYLEFLDALGLEWVHLVGHSLGGWIALEAAVRAPTRFKSLTLISSAGIHVKGVPKGDLFMRAPEVVFRSMFASEAVADAVLKQRRPDDAIAMKNRYAIARAAWHPPLFNPHLAKWLDRIRIPVRIVWGDSDRILPVDYAHAFNALLSGSSVEVIPACGHLPHVEQPDVLAASISSFIAGASR